MRLADNLADLEARLEIAEREFSLAAYINDTARMQREQAFYSAQIRKLQQQIADLKKEDGHG